MIQKYSHIEQLQDYEYKRYFYDVVDFNDKMVGIIGSRGIGKTTFILQYLKSLNIGRSKKLYFSADSIAFSNHSLYEIAETFARSGGEVLAIDEIHKYKNFEHELKEIYDFLDLKVIFSGSSALQLEHKKADLSRRAVLYRLHGLSFREFLELKLNKKFNIYRLDELLENHLDIAHDLTKRFKPFEHFKEYLQSGYFPYYFENPKSYGLKLEETVNTVIESDLPIIFNIEPQNIQKLKQLISLICSSKPFELNLTNLSKKIGINRTTLYQYIHYLNLGNLLYSLKAKTKGDTIFVKPSKLYLNNPNLTFYYCQGSDIGTIREQFFANMLRVNHQLSYPTKGDFLVDEKFTFVLTSLRNSVSLHEVGGKNKDFKQIANLSNSFVASDDIEVGFGAKIPLWLFGFLY